MPSPEISVVIPLYNKEREIGRCIRSVLAQSFRNFELIVINDGSTDGSAAIVRDCTDPRMRLVEKANGGLASARNRGIDEAQAELIAFLDADDEWCPEFLATILNTARLCPEAGVYFTAFWIHRGSGWARKVTIPARFLSKNKSILKDYYATPHGKVHPSAVAIWKRTFNTAGSFRPMFAEDVDMWLRIAASYPVAYSAAAQSIWNVNASNRMCVEQSGRRESHDPDGLVPSLKIIEESPGIPETTKQRALKYVAKRELRALWRVRYREGAQPAQYLMQQWEAAYGELPRHIRWAMRMPRALLRAVDLASTYGSKLQLACSYLWNRQSARKVIFSLAEEHPPSVAPSLTGQSRSAD